MPTGRGLPSSAQGGRGTALSSAIIVRVSRISSGWMLAARSL
jgi:hypothetical protein